MSTATSTIHSIPVCPLTGSISVPIYQTSTFVQEAPGVHKGFDYARSNNPTREALEKIIAQLEHGFAGFAFASGLAAIDAVLKLLKSGDEILAIDDIYGGAFRLFTHIYEKFGISIKYVDTSNSEAVAEAINERTRLIWVESPSNPTLKISDIAAIAAIAQSRNVLFCVDNTFATPILQNPIDLGADLVVHSGTKYIAGHSDLIAGFVVCKTAALAEQIKFIQNASGGILSPQDSFLCIRGIETLDLRVRKHCENAAILAETLSQHPAIDKVFYPGLSTHHNHQVANRQQKAFGGIISFTLKNDSIDAANEVVCHTRYFKLAESLGGVKSLVAHPASMTHKSIPAEKRQSAGVKDSLIRLSVGLEDVKDLIEDITQALNRVSNSSKTTSTVNDALLAL